MEIKEKVEKILEKFEVGCHSYETGGAEYPVKEAVKAILEVVDQPSAINNDLLEALKLVLPLAKGYATTNNVGSNQKYCNIAEQAISGADAFKGEKRELPTKGNCWLCEKEKDDFVCICKKCLDVMEKGENRTVELVTRLFKDRQDLFKILKNNPQILREQF